MADVPWHENLTEPVAAGVYRIPLPLPSDGLRAVNVYVVADGAGLTLIDAGWAVAGSLERLEKGIGALDHDLGAIRRILVTHVHRDHYSQAVHLRRLFGSGVCLGAGERLSLERLLDIRTNVAVDALPLLRRAGAAHLVSDVRRLGLLEPFRPEDWEHPDRWLTAGTLELPGRVLTVIPTPGHTRGHVVFLDPAAGLLFAGDHVLPHITPSIAFELAPPELPLGRYLDSLRLIASYPDATLLPAHGPAGGSVHRRVDELIAHHHDRFAECVRALDAGAATAAEVASHLGWTRRRRSLDELDAFNRMLAVLETLAHLDVLVSRSQLSVVQDGEITRFARVG
jgi:glyoxylase-like metal-dependent hydrolase (beta-lactamase superfamily II)